MIYSTFHRHAGTRFGLRPLGKAAFALCLSVGLLCGCSDDDALTGDGDLPQQPPQETGSSSTAIGSENVNFPIDGILSAQYADAPVGQDIGRLADKDAGTCFVTYHSKFYITFEGSEESVVNYYTLTSASDAPECDPKSWTLFGSTDGHTWTRLDRRKDQSFTERGEEKAFQCSNTTAYRYYRLDFDENHGGEATQIAELSLKKVAIEIKFWDIRMPAAGTLVPQYADFPQSTELGYAVDGSADTRFVVPHTRFYLMWQGSGAAIARHYTLTSAADAPEMDPKAWTLSGSNDGEEWTILDEREGQTFAARKEEKAFMLSNRDEYLYYKLEVTQNNGGSSTQIAEWNLHGYQDISDLIARSEGSTASAVTPLGKHFENRTPTTEEIKEWLRNPQNEAVITEGNEFGTFRWVEQSEPVVLYPFGKPLPADNHQRGIGNCCAVASLATMAYMYPDFIQSIIRDNGDKTYTVKMYEPMGEQIEVGVTNKFYSNEQGVDFGICGKNEALTWATVLEKALMKYRYIYWGSAGMGGIPQQETNPAFTGKGDEVYCWGPGKLTNEEMTRLVRAGIGMGFFITGGFNKALPIGSQGTVTGHCFSGMLSADPYALFSMRNPWGGDGEKDGVLDIPNDNIIPPTIDLMLMHAGKLQDEGEGVYEAYVPPVW